MKINIRRTYSNVAQGFSLLELLVVIAIIGLLAALLFTVVTRSREKARATRCMSNQRQIMTAALMWAQDHEEALPSAERVWADLALPARLLVCPSRPRLAQGYYYSAAASERELGTIPSPETFLVLGDGDRSQPAPLGSEPFDRRHHAKIIGAFADGHVALTRPREHGLLVTVGGLGNDIDLYVLTLTDRKMINLTNDVTGGFLWPAAHPDGSTIAIASGNRLLMLETEGAAVREIVQFEHLNNIIWLAWHPAGDHLLFCARDEREPQSQPQHIYTVDPDGTHLRCLLNNPWVTFNPVYSPDGTRIVFEAMAPNSGFTTSDIYIMDSDGGNIQRLTKTGGCRTPTFSPDGKTIVFSSSRDGNDEIYTMDTDGANQRRLTHNSVDDRLPWFSPDGQSIFYKKSWMEEGNPTMQSDMYVMDADGKHPTKVIDGEKSNIRLRFVHGWL